LENAEIGRRELAGPSTRIARSGQALRAGKVVEREGDYSRIGALADGDRRRGEHHPYGQLPHPQQHIHSGGFEITVATAAELRQREVSWWCAIAVYSAPCSSRWS